MEPDRYVIAVYLIYSVTSIGLVVWLARTLFHNGALFLEDVFEDKPRLAEAVNRLLVIGFYLLNLGYAFLILKADSAVDALSATEVLVHRLGTLLISLGVLHLLNMYVFYRIRRRAEVATLPPPVAPQVQWAPPAGQPVQ
ncbi:MAG: hypothetical protein ACRD0C_08660 [Acidimicrobiia bacterium]